MFLVVGCERLFCRLLWSQLVKTEAFFLLLSFWFFLLLWFRSSSSSCSCSSRCSSSRRRRTGGRRKKELEFGGEFFLGIETIREVYPANTLITKGTIKLLAMTDSFGMGAMVMVMCTNPSSANLPTVGMDLNTKSLDIISSIRTTGEIRKIKLDLIPAFIQTHWHCANERLHSSRRLIVRRTKPPLDALVVENLYLECEILIEILDNHDKEWQLDAQGLLRIGWGNNVACRNICSHNFQHRALNVLVRYSFNVPILHFRIPNLKRLRPNRIKNREESTLECVSEHRRAEVE